jgi:dienelactone hydrolase
MPAHHHRYQLICTILLTVTVISAVGCHGLPGAAPTAAPTVSNGVISPSPEQSLTSTSLPSEVPAPLLTSTPLSTLTPVSLAITTPTPPAVGRGQRPFSQNVQYSRTVQINYLLYLPGAYGKDPKQKWPLILYLHGRDQRGSDFTALKSQPLPKMLENRTDFPFIVISPQLPLDKLWWSDLIDPMDALIDQIETTYAVDPRRIYLTGLSMGGFGVWEYALRYPKRFAAIVPIAGGYIEGSHDLPVHLCDLKNVAIWVFHGEADTIVNPYQSQDLVNGLKSCGIKVHFTLYPNTDHEGSWTKAYADPELYKWLVAQTLK